MTTHKVGIWLAAGGLGCGVLLGAWHHFHPLVLRLKDGRWVLPNGILLNARSRELGTPEEAEADFQKIYAAILAFGKAKNRLPYSPQELLGFARTSRSVELSDDNLFTSDYVLSDEFAQGARDQLGYHFDLRTPRPDGKLKPLKPTPPEKDAWVSTDHYTRSNAVMYPDKSVERFPSGFYIVLWSNGEIERIPVGNRLWANVSDGLEAFFPGQAALPKGARKESLVGAFQGAMPAGYVDGPAPMPLKGP